MNTNVSSDVSSNINSDSVFRLLSPESQAKDVKDTDKEKIKQYIQSLVTEKEKISLMTKDEMVSLIIRQNNLITQQTQSMMEIVDLSNMIQDANKGNDVCTETQKQNQMCTQISGLQKQQMIIYEQSQKIQLLLFLLFILVVGWLIYHHIHKLSNNTL
jgi:hypothetical protein